MRAALVCVLALGWLAGCDDEGKDPKTVGPDVDQGLVDILAACEDGRDNDGDGLVDLDDPGCTGASDEDETDAPLAACADGQDNDDDGAIDLADPGCADGADNDESDDPPPPQCDDGLDDDNDGATDLADPGCASARDDDESDDPALPACADGADNDADGFVDFPADPGCGSEFDDDEGGDGPPLPQCSDGIDNDMDGRVDLADPGCTSAADPREQTPDERPVCSDGLDNDGDGIVDFPLEPGCSSAGDDDEEDPARAPQCGNGADDDADGLTDYPVDPGCAGVGDGDETDPPVLPACSDGRDNDRDGLIDYPADPGCSSAADGTELGSCGGTYDVVDLESGREFRGNTGGGPFVSDGTCGGRGSSEVVFGYRVDEPIEALEITTQHPDTAVETVLYVRRDCLDRDTELACNREPLDDGVAGNRLVVPNPARGDYYIFVDGATGASGAFVLTVNAVPRPECRNGRDDDADGRVDYPADPGCADPDDTTEVDPDPLPQCADDDDNDGDGLVDYPLDVGCFAASDNDEVDVCGQGVQVLDFPVEIGTVLGDSSEGGNNLTGTCGGQAAPERIYRYALRHNANLAFTINHEETIMNTLLYVRAGDCTAAQAERGCAPLAVDPRGGPGGGRVEIDRAAPGDYYVIVDNAFGLGGPFRLSVEVERLPAGCSDAFDNDGDGFIDGEDPGCESPDDENEVEEAGPFACSNGLDDDGDGIIDYPNDPGCFGRGDQDEGDPMVQPACANGRDDDMDDLVDYPADSGCSSAADDSEVLPRPAPLCNNRIDDDMDSLADYPLDPGCAAPGDLSEADDDMPPACADEADNDRDGLVDYPFDPGCEAAGDQSENDPDPRPVCSNRVDDDGDGRVDFPRDPGCTSAADADEADPAFQPQCANGRDDDGNGRIDWPDDPGCRFAADNTELQQGPVLARCADGIDNDDDGLVDLADIGCTGARDNDEADPAQPPFCANGRDDDGDGQVDWPADDGCAARGDECEQAGYGICNGQCLDLQNDVNNCGVCGRACNDGVECIRGFCGGLFTFEGIRQNVPDADLGGWEVCHRDLYAESAAVINNILAACDGDYVMYGCRQVGQPNWQLVAMGERDIVFRNTGDNNNVLNDHNGVSWYFSQGYSIGFVQPGTGVSRNSCDTGNAQPDLRLCWHTGGGRLNGGYRCGARTGLNGARDWERVIWTSR
ncbi:MAG: hypothetical protein R3F60_28165 [bacterium]